MSALQREGPYLKIRTWVAILAFLLAIVLAGYPTLIGYGRDSNRLATVETTLIRHDNQIDGVRNDLVIIKAQLAVQTEILRRLERRDRE